MAKYADITRIDAPSSAVEGATVTVDVVVKNIGASDQYLAVTAVFNSMSVPFQLDYLLVSAGQMVIFRGVFTMPAKNAGVTAWSWYWDGSDWVQDDRYDKQISLSQAPSEFGAIEITSYERR